MDALIPGRILVVDDVYEDVADIVQRFREEGCGVIYREGPSDDIGELSNVRLVILDLDLKGLGPGTDLEWPALVLQRLAEGGNAFYLVAVWSKHVRNEGIPDDRDWLVELKEAYAEQKGRPFPDLFLRPFRKQPEQAELLERIEQWIIEEPYAGLVFEWERLLNKARDHATSDILDLEGGSLSSLVKVLRKEVGEGANRELVQLFNKVLLRYMTTGDLAEISGLMNGLGEGGEINLDWYARFHRLQAYYRPDKAEPVWTGDIFETAENDYQRGYTVMITPQCDLAQRKVDRIKIAYAMRVDDSSETQQQAFKTVRPGKSFHQDGELTNRAAQFLKGIAGEGGLSGRFYILRFVHAGEMYFHLLVDLHDVHSVPLVEAEQDWKQKRICRLDSPYIEDMLQHYAALSARVGVPAIPPKVRREEAKRLIGA
jgi:hypothetical protein